jgi:hypothetical protein
MNCKQSKTKKEGETKMNTYITSEGRKRYTCCKRLVELGHSKKCKVGCAVEKCDKGCAIGIAKEKHASRYSVSPEKIQCIRCSQKYADNSYRVETYYEEEDSVMYSEVSLDGEVEILG